VLRGFLFHRKQAFGSPRITGKAVAKANSKRALFLEFTTADCFAGRRNGGVADRIRSVCRENPGERRKSKRASTQADRLSTRHDIDIFFGFHNSFFFLGVLTDCPFAADHMVHKDAQCDYCALKDKPAARRDAHDVSETVEFGNEYGAADRSEDAARAAAQPGPANHYGGNRCQQELVANPETRRTNVGSKQESFQGSQHAGQN